MQFSALGDVETGMWPKDAIEDTFTLAEAIFISQIAVDFVLMVWMLAMRRDGEVMCILHMGVEGSCKLALMCTLDFLIKTSLVVTTALFRQHDEISALLFPLLGVTLGGITFHLSMWYRTHVYRPYSMGESIPPYLPNPLLCLVVQWASHIAIFFLTHVYASNIMRTCSCPLWRFALFGNFCTMQLCFVEMYVLLGVNPMEYVSHRVLLMHDMQKMYEEYIHMSGEQQA